MTLIKILTFNIEYGGNDFNKVVELIKKSDADIVAIQEAFGNMPKLAEAMEWKYYDPKLQIMSKYPIFLTSYNYIYIYVSGFIAITNVHLPDIPNYDLNSNDNIRLTTLQPYINDLLKIKNTPSLIVGDFNEPSHLDKEYKNLFTACSYHLSNNDFHDVFRIVSNKPGITYWAKRPGYESLLNEPEDRLDFIYANSLCLPINCYIIDENDIQPYPSDHRAVCATFSIINSVNKSLISPRKRCVSKDENAIIDYFTLDDSHTLFIHDKEYKLQKGYGFIDIKLTPAMYTMKLVANNFIVYEHDIYVLPDDIQIFIHKLTIVWKHAPGNRWDWIGIIRRDHDPLIHDVVYYFYTNSTIYGSKNIDFKLDDNEEYDLIYCIDDSYQCIARIPIERNKEINILQKQK